MKNILRHKFENIISIDNLLFAWQEFVKGKRNKRDVQEFAFCLMDNIFNLHHDLVNFKYKHGDYQQFKISDPKSRTIHKASVRDRLLHHAVYRILYPFFDKKFIADSFSCRNNKGIYKALNRIEQFARIVSKNNTHPCHILKCDIKKFFASVDQLTMIKILEKHILDKDILNLLREIIFSFKPNGLPLGNLTSQLFANIYLNELDQFAKHNLKVKYYIRYADDFVILSSSKGYLENLISEIKGFLQSKLKLTLHPDKIYFRQLKNGVDFLGWVNFFDCRFLRTKTKKRMFNKIKNNKSTKIFNSYLGLLKHGSTNNIKNNVINLWLNFEESFD